MLALAGIAAIFCRCRDDPTAANPATPLHTLCWTFSAKRCLLAAAVSYLSSVPALIEYDMLGKVRLRSPILPCAFNRRWRRLISFERWRGSRLFL
jgi:hypothetical protein